MAPDIYHIPPVVSGSVWHPPVAGDCGTGFQPVNAPARTNRVVTLIRGPHRFIYSCAPGRELSLGQEIAVDWHAGLLTRDEAIVLTEQLASTTARLLVEEADAAKASVPS